MQIFLTGLTSLAGLTGLALPLNCSAFGASCQAACRYNNRVSATTICTAEHQWRLGASVAEREVYDEYRMSIG